MIDFAARIDASQTQLHNSRTTMCFLASCTDECRLDSLPQTIVLCEIFHHPQTAKSSFD